MKKLSIILSVIALLPLSTRAENALNLYGIIDIGVQYLSTRQSVLGISDSQQFLGIANGVQSGSRFGMRGFHDFGGGVES